MATADAAKNEETKATPGATAGSGVELVGSQRDNYECPVCHELCA